MQQRASHPIVVNANQLIKDGNTTQAIALLSQGLKQYPSLFEGWLLLSKCLYDAGYVSQAIDVAKHAEGFDPLQKEFSHIQMSMQQKSFDEAKEIATQMLEAVPHHPRAIYTLAHIALENNQPEHCVSVLEDAITNLPATPVLRHLHTDACVQSGLFSKAIDSAEAIVKLAPSFDTYWKLIGLLQKYAQHSQLLTACEAALPFAKQDNVKQSQLWLIKGQSFRVVGERKQSIAALRQSITLHPQNVDAWWALADFKDYTFSSEDKTCLEILSNDTSLPGHVRSVATFALAKAFELNEGIAPSMPLYEKANRLASPKQFEPQLMVKEFEARKLAYTQTSVKTQATLLPSTPTPIFIVGLPRSGSTLIEQILASHPLIQGTIEQPTLAYVESQAERLCMEKYGESLHQSLPRLSDEDLALLGRSYLDKGALFRGENTLFFTDKQPFNFRLIGLIHKILPQAIIVDIRRDPMDCGLSLYKQHFHSGVPFSYDLKHIGEAYNAYADLMTYWHTILPNRILEIQYENLINAPETEINRLLNHVGVNFDSSCMNFYEYRRNIHTASSEQVRQPINSKAVGVWREVADSLSDLFNVIHR
ncbi:sulfotransferase family protein [Alteromonas sediminis]|uniref:Sulfotransferase family protein n=1 Tax=Alteromonas sediminis TaxID=2259342 RepID=A0A3N5Z838_9ALTE|nr:tetratricopeptide repeat-containing sulfotransferase family protein [Alteromonas sediminis]RPJ65128.1 sulfotransferase family protein [Alteromonas sediminis]